MSVGNLGSVMTQLQGYIASEFLTNSNQGLSLFPRMCEMALTRADMTDANARVTVPALHDGINDVDVEAGAVHLVGIVAYNGDTEVQTVYCYNTNLPIEGTSLFHAALILDTLTAKALVFPEPIPMAALSWSVVQSDTPANQKGILLASPYTVRVMLVYTE